MRSFLLVVASLILVPGLARADIPMSLNEPEEDAAKEAAQAWLTAMQAGDAKALVELGLFGFSEMKVTYVQRTAPADAKAKKRCGKLGTATTAKAMKKLLPCLVTPDLKAALAAADLNGEERSRPRSTTSCSRLRS
jgi:hypothetical protein